jgi:hypothetical protein
MLLGSARVDEEDLLSIHSADLYLRLKGKDT